MEPNYHTVSDKYHRTLHLPWSPGATSDDKYMPTAEHLVGKEAIISEKLDGENNCLTTEEDGYYARSHGGMPTHVSNRMGRTLHKALRYSIDPNLSVFVEYCYAVHSIKYNLGLPSYFFVFGVRDDKTKVWWGWDDVCLMASVLNLPTVPVLWRGVVSSVAELKTLTESYCKNQASVYGTALEDGSFQTRSDKVTVGIREGVVVKLTESYTDPSKTLGKWVRPNHVATDQHWREKQVERQELRDEG